MKNQIFFLFIVLSAAFLHSCAPTKKLSLVGAFQPGQQFSYRVTETVESQTEAVDEPMAIPANQTVQLKITDYRYTVKAIRPDQSVDMEMVIRRVYEKETNQEGTTEFDSDQPDPDSMAAKAQGKALAFRILVNHPFNMTLSPAGEVLSLRGMDDAWDEIEQKFREESPMASSMLKNMKTQFGDETMREGQNAFWNYQPGRKMAVGQKWKRPYSLSALNISGQTTYTLREYNDKNARIAFVSTYTSDKNKPGVMDMGMIKIRYNLSGSGSGTITTSQPYATPQHIDQTMIMSGPMEVKTSFTGWITIPIKMTMHSVLERTE